MIFQISPIQCRVTRHLFASPPFTFQPCVCSTYTYFSYMKIPNPWKKFTLADDDVCWMAEIGGKKVKTHAIFPHPPAPDVPSTNKHHRSISFIVDGLLFIRTSTSKREWRETRFHFNVFFSASSRCLLHSFTLIKFFRMIRTIFFLSAGAGINIHYSNRDAATVRPL